MILKPTKIDLTIEQLSAKSFINFIVELQNLLEYIGTELLAVNQTVSIAESVTAGFLQFSFSQMSDASQFFKGGITAYTVTEKIDILNVEENQASESNGVSPAVAESMALNVADLFKSDWSIAVTGYANPIKKSREKLYAYFSITYKGKIILTEKLDLHSRTMSLKAQLYYSEFVLGCFKLELDKRKQLEKPA